MAFAHRRNRTPLETTDEKLVDAMEMADAGVRLAVPQLAEQLGIGVKDPPVKEQVPTELRDLILERLQEHHEAYIQTLKLLDRCADPIAHIAIGDLVGRLKVEAENLEERWGDQ